MNLDQKNSLKACLEEETDNPRMKNYVKILDTPNISAFEWIHRVQEELMDGIVYLEKLREILQLNMRELDAARLAALKETETKMTGTDDESASDLEKEEEETIEININVTPSEQETEKKVEKTENTESKQENTKPKRKKIKVMKPKVNN